MTCCLPVRDNVLHFVLVVNTFCITITPGGGQPKHKANNSNGGKSEAKNIEHGKKNQSSERLRIAFAGFVVAAFLFAGIAVLVFIAFYYLKNALDRALFLGQAISGFLVLAVIIAQAVIYYLQSQTMAKQLKISDDTFRLLQRPSLGVVSVEAAPTKDGNGRAIKAVIENTGHLPARAATVIVSGAKIPVGVPEEVVESELWPLIPPEGHLLSKGSIPINSSMISFALPTMTNTEYELIKANRMILYACVRVDYGMDGKTQPYFVEYYGRFSRYTEAFDLCETHNDAN